MLTRGTDKVGQLPPPSHAGLFSKGRASVKTEVRKSGKENRRPGWFRSLLVTVCEMTTFGSQYLFGVRVPEQAQYIPKKG